MQMQADSPRFSRLSRKNLESISSWMRTASAGRIERKNEAKRFVLLVDSRPMRQFYTSVFLQRLKYEVMMTKTAEDALLFMKLAAPLIIIANVDLPQMSGIDFLRQVKQDRRTSEIPFLIYTSNKDPQVRRVCEEAGCAAYLTHLARLDDLYAEIQKATTEKPRRFVRLDTTIDVIVGENRRAGSPPRRDYITAISEKGMFVSTDNPLTYGGVHTFTFFLPTAPGWVFTVEGQVLYRHPFADVRKQPGMGVKFLNMGEHEQALIKDFISKKIMEGIAEE
jgi:CheY-like chemotaxis protein